LLPLIPACILTVAINAFVFQESPEVIQVVGNMFGLNGVVVKTLLNNVPLWSLAFEIWFYILGGTLGWIASGRSNVFSIICLAVCALVFGKLTSAYLLFWILGALTSISLRVQRAKWLFVLGAVLMATGSAFYQIGISGRLAALAEVPTPLLEGAICAGFCLTIPCLCGHPLNSFLSSCRRGITFLSNISFSLYLVHFPIIVVLRLFFRQAEVIDLHSICIFLLCVGVSILCAIIFWVVFERNTSNLRHFLRSKVILRSRVIDPTSAGTAIG
jgi:peptidoglycan/LPS O-acetylase OafA/YrhL